MGTIQFCRPDIRVGKVGYELIPLNPPMEFFECMNANIQDFFFFNLNYF